MKNKVSLLFLSCLLALSLVLSACSSPSASSKPESAPAVSSEESSVTEESSAEESSSVEETAPVTEYPLTVTDMTGREVTIPEKPEKLVSGYYISTSALLGLQLTDQLVGIESKANTRPLYKFSAPSLLDLTDVGTLKEVNLEACAAAEPDLIILNRKQKAAADSLTELGFPVFLVDPESHEQLTEMITLLGLITDHQAEAANLNGELEAIQIQLAESLEGVDTPTVYLGGNSAFLSTAGAGMYQSKLIEMAGGKNVADEIEDNDWAEISYEQLLAWDPDVILISSSAKYTLEELESDENLKDLKALKEHRVFVFQNVIEPWDSPIPAAVLGSYVLASDLHPDQISESQCLEVIQKYYEEFYHFTPEIE